MKIKFKVTFILILALSLVIFTACSQNDGDIPSNTEPDQSEEPAENTNPEQEIEEEEDEVEIQEPEENDEDEDVSIEIEPPSEEEIKIDSGTYVGFVDGNHIEIKISGVPEEMASKVFIVDEDSKKIIEEEIITDDQVKFEYYLNEDEVGVITDIEKIIN